MIENGFTPKQHWIFSDGCSAQFKCSRAIYFVAKYPNLTDVCKMLWQYFGSGHGKGEWDGARAVVLKSRLRHEQRTPP